MTPADIIDPTTQEYTGEVLVPSTWRKVEGVEFEIKIVGWHYEGYWIFEYLRYEGQRPSSAHAAEKRGMKKICDRGPASLRALYRPVGWDMGKTTEEASK